jgi:hypothetical protein
MDYTTLERVKRALDATEETDDDLLEECITAASRAVDRHCSGRTDIDDYFALETVTDEIGLGRAAVAGYISYLCAKPVVTVVSAFSWREKPADGWDSVDLAQVEVGPAYMIKAWHTSNFYGQVRVKVTYTGGYGASVAHLPADLVDAVTVLTVRFYKEIKSGLGDSIGVAELGEMVYTKALPVRVVKMLQPFVRLFQ